MDLETLVGVIQGRIKVHWHCYRADEMARMLAVAKEFGFTIQAFHHAVESYKVRDLLKAHKTGVVSWVNWWGFKAESLDAIPENLALLAASGVVAAMHSDSPLVIQRLNQEAALAYYRGRDMGLNLSESDAIRFVTLNPARILGIDPHTGSIEEGKMADLTLWDQHPLTVTARAEKVFVDGHLVFDRLDPSKRRRSDFELQMVPNPPELDKASTESVVLPELPEGWSVPVRPTSTRAEAGAGAPVAIVGGTVHTMDGRTLSDGTVILQGDRVKAVGKDLPVPAGAKVVDAKGQVVTPGLVAAESTLGLVEISAERGTRDHRPAGKQPTLMRADLRTWDALNPASAAIGVNRIEGFTTAVIRAYGGLISGQAAAFDLQGLHPEQTYLTAPVAVHANLGLGSSGEAGGSRAMAMKRLRRLLDDARILKQYGQAVERRRYRKLSAPFAELRALIPVVDRRIPLVITVNRAADILAALRLCQKQKIRLVLSGAAEGWRVAEAIARDRVPVLVEVDNNLPSSFDALGGRFDNAARLSRAGVVVGLSAAGGAHNVRALRQMAGIATAWGMPHQNAVLKAGARANVVVWNGDPLALSTRVQHLFIGGQRIPLTSRQTQLRDRYRQLGRL
jgi:imidazolonepropionase-like amidohydrolase